jgi:nicotinate-nucleotide adenylyltransferase
MHVSPRPGWPESDQSSPQLWQWRFTFTIYDLRFTIARMMPVPIINRKSQMKLGLFGGSFDPVHLGHLLVAQAAIEELGLDRLFFIPAAQSPFKPDSKPATTSARLQLLRLALAGRTNCGIDEQEIRRGGISYTVDTLRDYAKRFPGAELFYLIGADHAAKLIEWREANELAKLAEFVVVPRPGESAAKFPKPFRGRILKGFPIEISSSQIRARVKAGLPIENLVPRFAAEAIHAAKLYI